MEIRKIEIKNYTTDTDLLLIANKSDLEKRVRDSKLDEVKKTFEAHGSYCEVTLEQNGTTIICALPVLTSTLDAVSGKYKPYTIGGISKVLPLVTDLIADNEKDVFVPTTGFNPSTMSVADLTAIANSVKGYLNARKASITDATITTQIDSAIRNVDNVLSFMSASGYKINKADVDLVNGALETALTKAGVDGTNLTEVTTYLTLLTNSKQLQEKSKALSMLTTVKNFSPKKGLTKFSTRHPKLSKFGKAVGVIAVAGGLFVGGIAVSNNLNKDNATNNNSNHYPSTTATPAITQTVVSTLVPTTIPTAAPTATQAANSGVMTLTQFDALYSQNLTRFQQYKDELGKYYQQAVYGYTFIENCSYLDTDSMGADAIEDCIRYGDLMIGCLVSSGQYENVSQEARLAINGGIETSVDYIEENNAKNGTSLLDYMTVGRSAEVRLMNAVSQSQATKEELYNYNATIYNPGLSVYKEFLANGIEMGASLNNQKTLGTHPAMISA